VTSLRALLPWLCWRLVTSRAAAVAQTMARWLPGLLILIPTMLLEKRNPARTLAAVAGFSPSDSVCKQ
jgi:hypothetical protein